MTNKTKRDSIQEIADRIAAMLRESDESGTPLPWHKPWASGGTVEYDTETITVQTTGHYNGTSGRGYNGLNPWFLDATASACSYDSFAWTTYKQAQKLATANLLKLGYEPERTKEDKQGNVVGGWGWTYAGEGDAPLGDAPCPGVRKGEEGTPVFFWSFFVSWTDKSGKVIRKPSKARIAKGDLTRKSVPSCRVYSVFNWSQCDSLPEPKAAQPKTMTVSLRRVKDPAALGIPVEVAEAYPAVAAVWAQFAEATGCTLSNAGNRACYSSAAHEIWMPPVEQFTAKNAEQGLNRYCATLLHEMTHATGHAKVLNRQLGNRFGSEAYAFEELIAEIGSASLCHALGIHSELREDHASYIQSWIKRIEQDKYSIHTAARMSREAVGLLLPESTSAEADDVAEAA